MLSAFADVFNTGVPLYPGIDWETYSEAGYWYSDKSRKGKGLEDVGVAVYSEHSSTEVLMLSYQLVKGGDIYTWLPGMPPPGALFHAIGCGTIFSAANSYFEFKIWNNVAVKKLGWLPLPLEQLRDTLAASLRWSMPASLDNAAKVLGIEAKNPEGKRLINTYSKPQTMSKKYPAKRRYLIDYPTDFFRMVEYNRKDVTVESCVSARIPHLSPYEEQLWLTDQRINDRGVRIDIRACNDAQYIIKRVFERYEEELQDITNGYVSTAGQTAKIKEWLESQGEYVPDLTEASVTAVINSFPPENCLKVLEIRQTLASASVKKIPAFLSRTCRDGRARGLLKYCGAGRTGRWSGSGIQGQNLPRSGPSLNEKKWSWMFYDEAFADIQTRDIDYLIRKWCNPLKLISGLLRGMFISAPGYNLISSDFSAIEAVVLASLAGEEWRLEIFRTHGKIYEHTASMITGTPVHQITEQLRALGKVAELASGYQGSVNAWKAFGAEEFLTEGQPKASVKLWRQSNRYIVKFWKEIEKAAKLAVQNPGRVFTYRDISYEMHRGVLYCKLPSGRFLAYHGAHTRPDVTDWGKPIDKIYFCGWNSNPKFGKIGWALISTYGGKLTENITQAVARDIHAAALMRLDSIYPTVMHTHDEAVGEVPEGYGSTEQYESIMTTNPSWCRDWPIKAAGGWIGKRYRK